MIALESIPIQLKVNSAGSINTGRYFNKNDNNVGKFVFTIFREDGTELDYTQISQAYMIIKFQDGTHLEPCSCTINEGSLEYTLCKNVLSKVGTASGVVRVYGSNEQILTTNIFRFVTIDDILDGIVLSEEDKISLVNDLISKLSTISFDEDARQSAELNRIANESVRIQNESDRIANESDRVDSENLRKSNEDLRDGAELVRVSNEAIREDGESGRIIAEDNRVTAESDRVLSEDSRVTAETKRDLDFKVIQDEYVSLVATLKDSLNQMIVFDIPSLTNPPDTEIHKILFSTPINYTFTITDITIISKGVSSGIDDINTSQIQIIEGTDIISEITFNSTTTFPLLNETKEMIITDGLIDKDNDVYVKLTNDIGVTTPSISLQINYDIKKVT